MNSTWRALVCWQKHFQPEEGKPECPFTAPQLLLDKNLMEIFPTPLGWNNWSINMSYTFWRCWAPVRCKHRWLIIRCILILTPISHLFQLPSCTSFTCPEILKLKICFSKSANKDCTFKFVPSCHLTVAEPLTGWNPLKVYVFGRACERGSLKTLTGRDANSWHGMS